MTDYSTFPASAFLANDTGTGIRIVGTDLPTQTVDGYFDAQSQTFYLRSANQGGTLGLFTYTIADARGQTSRAFVDVKFGTGGTTTIESPRLAGLSTMGIAHSDKVGSGASLEPTAISGLAPGDLYVMLVTSNAGLTGGGTGQIEPGWTTVAQSASSTYGVQIWYRILDGDYIAALTAAWKSYQSGLSGEYHGTYNFFPNSTFGNPGQGDGDKTFTTFSLYAYKRPAGLVGDLIQSIQAQFSDEVSDGSLVFTPTFGAITKQAFVFDLGFPVILGRNDETNIQGNALSNPLDYAPGPYTNITYTRVNFAFALRIVLNDLVTVSGGDTGSNGVVNDPRQVGTAPVPTSDSPVQDFFTYTLTDKLGHSVTANVTVTIVPCSIAVAPVLTGKPTIGPFTSTGNLRVITPVATYTPDPVTVTDIVPPVTYQHTPVHGYGVFRATSKTDGPTADIDPKVQADLGVDKNGLSPGNPADPFNWNLWRRKPFAMDTNKLKSALIYDLNTEIVQGISAQSRPIVRRSPDTPRSEPMSKKTPKTIAAEPLRLDGINVYDPYNGMVPGVAGRELSYISEIDPASYNGDVAWGRPQVGMLWWDTSRSPYVEAQTDVLDDGDQDRVAREIAYRRAQWGRFAPGSTVSVWEWKRSTDLPPDTDIIPNNLQLVPYVANDEYDDSLGQIQRFYYYWSLNDTTQPFNIKGRSLSAQQVASILADPTGEGISWIAPIIPNGLLTANVDPYLDNKDSVLQIETATDDYEGVIHFEWQIARNGDDRMPPPDALVRQMAHSLVGFDDFQQTVPDLSLPERQRMGVGLRPRRSLFAVDQTDLLAGRQSFVGIVNAIFARTNLLIDHPEVVDELTRSTPTYPYLTWAQPIGSSAIELPPPGAYDLTATSISELAALLTSQSYRRLTGYRPVNLPFAADYCTGFRSPRILVTNFEAAQPSWTIWELPVSAWGKDGAADQPMNYISVAKAFDLTYDTYAEALLSAAAGEVQVGQRCLITADERYDGMWTIFYWAPTAFNANTDGFVFESAQTYRTSDFFSVVDWYATDYDALHPPIITYQTINDRNLTEGPTPRNIFVKINDDSTGSWIWTYYDGLGWNTVARQNATIRISDKFYDPARVVYGIADKDPSLVFSRDGTLELRQIELALRESVLSKAQKIELFFSLLHFAHTRQDQVNWAFKTSFMSVVGFNEQLLQTPIAAYDTTENLLEYLDEVKPYRVKTRDFTRILTPPVDVANTHVTDFDKPLYYDKALDAYRRLDPFDGSDMALMATTPPYIDWYNAFRSTVYDPTKLDYNGVRRMRIRMRFDRINKDLSTPIDSSSPWDKVPWDVLAYDADGSERDDHQYSAWARLIAWYTPTEGMIAKDQTDTLLDMGFKGTIIDGGTMSGDQSDIDSVVDGTPSKGSYDLTLNPETKGVPSYGLRAPAKEANRPPEMMVATVNVGLGLTAHTGSKAGAPPQATAEIDTHGNRRAKITLPFPLIAASDDAVMVYQDGRRARLNVDYTIDHTHRQVQFKMPAKDRPKVLEAQVFAPGATTAIEAQSYFQGDGKTASFTLERAPTGPVDAIVDGTPLAASAIQVAGALVTLAPPPAKGSLVVLTGYAAGGRPVRFHTERLTYRTDQTWPLTNVAPVSTLDILGTIVEVEGHRLTPPFARYGSFSEGNRAIPLRKIRNIANLTVYLDGQVYGGGIEHHKRYAEADAREVEAILAAATTDLVVINRTLYATNPAITNTKVLAILREGHDFDITSGAQGRVLKILPPLGRTDWGRAKYDSFGANEGYSVLDGLRIDVTSFENDDLLGIETHVFDGSNGAVYVMPTTKGEPGETYVWVDGRRLLQGRDYTLTHHPVGYDLADLDDTTLGFDDMPITLVNIPGVQSRQSRVVITIYTGKTAVRASTWRMNSAVPGPALPGARLLTPGSDGNAIVKTAVSSKGPRTLYGLQGSYEVFEFTALDEMILAADLSPDDETISVTLNPRGLNPSLYHVEALSAPDIEAGVAGVIQIGVERIEYFELTRDGNTATLGQLRRGTRLTPPGPRPRLRTILIGDGSTATFVLAGADIKKPVEVGLRAATGQVIGLTLLRDFTTAAIDGGVLVTLKVAPAVGASAFAVQTREPLHPQGTQVRNVTRRPVDERYGPFHRRQILDVVATEPSQTVYRS